MCAIYCCGNSVITIPTQHMHLTCACVIDQDFFGYVSDSSVCDHIAQYINIMCTLYTDVKEESYLIKL